MLQFSIARLVPPVRLALALLLGACVGLIGCSVRAGFSANSSADSSSASRAEAGTRSSSSSRKKSGVRLKARATASSSSGSHARSKNSIQSSGKARVVFRAKPRVKLVARAKSPPRFVGTGRTKVSTRASGKTRGKVALRRPRRGSTPTRATVKRPDPVTKQPAGTKTEDGRPSTGRPATPSDEELEDPIDPPEAPSDNVFGYETPVRGCFEGQVFFIAEDSKKLPDSYDELEASSVVYACEWDIAARDFEQGFPGVEDRFEWFTIRYAGAFRAEQAGTWKFRISSDDGAKLYIDGKLVIDNDGVHPPRVRQGSVQLSSGDHEMVLEYFQGPRYHINLELFATPPGGEEGLFSVR